MDDQWVAGKFFLKGMVFLLGFLLIIPSGYKIYRYVSLKCQRQETIGYVSKTGTGNHTWSKPYVRFVDKTGRYHEVRSEVNYHFFFAPRKGDAFRVFFTDINPEEAIVDSPLHYLYIPVVFILIGGYLLFCSLRKKME